MEDQTSWKGHTFTLLIFGGIVVLCSIFFVLGMLVGRAQSVKLGAVATADAAAKPQAKEPVREDFPPLPEKQSRFEAAPVKSTPEKPVEPAPTPKVAEEPASAPPPTTINLQISALGKQSDAEKLVDDLKKKGFRAFVMSPAPDESSPFYRVQVGASNPIEAQSLKLKLEAAGYKPIVKK